MPLRDLPLRWILVLVVVVLFGAHRIRLALRSTEDSIRDRVEHMLEGFERKQPKWIVKGLSDDFIDEDTRYGRREVRDATRALLAPGTRYRAQLAPENGLVFLTDLDSDPEQVDATLHCLIESRPSGPGSENSPWTPFWDLHLTATFARESGVWKVLSTRQVNHDQRPRW